jgi:hypothetical protein
MTAEGEDMQETTWALFTLSLNLGLVASVIDQFPENVREGFMEKLGIIKEWAEAQIEEVQMFGEAYDDGEDAA